jgi:translation initiation factor IF-1
MYLFETGDIVYLRDFPMGKPTRVFGKVVGVLSNEFYNVLLTNGINADTIRRYKSYELAHIKDVPNEIKKNQIR